MRILNLDYALAETFTKNAENRGTFCPRNCQILHPKSFVYKVEIVRSIFNNVLPFSVNDICKQFPQMIKKDYNKALEQELAEKAGTDNLKVVKGESTK